MKSLRQAAEAVVARMCGYAGLVIALAATLLAGDVVTEASGRGSGRRSRRSPR